MRDLTPQIAVKLAEAAYEIKDKKEGSYKAPALDLLAKNFDFNLSNNVVQGTVYKKDSHSKFYCC